MAGKKASKKVSKVSFKKAVSNKGSRKKYTRNGPRYKKKRMNNVQVMGQGGQISYTTTKSKPTLHKSYFKMLKLNAPNYDYISGAGRLSSTVGIQTALTRTYCDAASLKSMYDVINNQLGAGGVYAGTLTTKFFIDQIRGTLRLTNCDNGNCEVILYDVITYRDSAYSPLNVFAAGITNEANTGLINGIQGQAITSSRLDVYPQMSQAFNQFYKVVNKTRIVLALGQSHVHKVKYTPKKLYNNELYNQNPSIINYKGLSYHTILQINGMPTNNVAKTEFSLGDATIDYVYTAEVKYKYWAGACTQIFNRGANLLQTYTGGEEVMNVASGTVTVNAQA